MSAHTSETKAPGKYDCHFDSWIHGELLDGEPGDGDVDSPTGWFAALDLEIECEGHEHDPSIPSSVAGVSIFCDGRCRGDEYLAAQHYGSRWLIIKEDVRGFVGVFPFEDEEKRDTMITLLTERFNEWFDDDGDQL